MVRRYRSDLFDKALIFILFMLLCYTLGGYSIVQNPPPHYPFMYDEMENLLFANNLLSTGKFEYSDEITSLNKEFEYPIGGVPYSVWSKNADASIPARMIGGYLFVALVVFLFSEHYLYVYPALLFCSAILFAIITSDILVHLDEKVPKKSVVLLSLTTFCTFFPFISWANLGMDSIPALFFFLLFLFLIIRYYCNGSRSLVNGGIKMPKCGGIKMLISTT